CIRRLARRGRRRGRAREAGREGQVPRALHGARGDAVRALLRPPGGKPRCRRAAQRFRPCPLAAGARAAEGAGRPAFPGRGARARPRLPGEGAGLLLLRLLTAILQAWTRTAGAWMDNWPW